MGGEGINEERIALAQKLLDEMRAKKAAKQKVQKARWDFYKDQLSKGNSNIGTGAKKATRRRGKIFRYK